MTIVAKFAGKCAECDGAVEPGQRIEWDKATKEVRHESCVKTSTPPVVAKAKPSYAPTSEQVHALELFKTGKSLAIEAGAGTGKTSTLLLLAESTDRRGQYIAFNKAIVGEAKAKMPGNVNASTAHSLAYKAIGHKYSDRLRNSRRIRSKDIAKRVGIDPFTLKTTTGPKYLSAQYLGGLAMATVTRFCQSADLEPLHRHVPYIDGIDDLVDGKRGYKNNEVVRRAILPSVVRAWEDLMSDDGQLPFRHDHYLKAWQLSGPKISADFILFDEAQDANPVMVAIVAAQTHAQLVWVGDSQQQIYTFTGAINALADVPADSKAFLTQSFRFGPEIALIANDILADLDAELRITGTHSISSTVGPVAEPDAILTRTNATAVRTVLRLQETGQRPALVGGGEEVVRFAKAAQELMDDGHTDFPDLACFDSWSEVKAYVLEDELGAELQLMVKLVEDFGVPTILEALDRVTLERDATVIVSTAHKSKGREWPSVQLADDFPTEAPSADELRLLYVACTRAKLELDIESVVVLNATGQEEV